MILPLVLMYGCWLSNNMHFWIFMKDNWKSFLFLCGLLYANSSTNLCLTLIWETDERKMKKMCKVAFYWKIETRLFILTSLTSFGLIEFHLKMQFTDYYLDVQCFLVSFVKVQLQRFLIWKDLKLIIFEVEI